MPHPFFPFMRGSDDMQSINVRCGGEMHGRYHFTELLPPQSASPFYGNTLVPLERFRGAGFSRRGMERGSVPRLRAMTSHAVRVGQWVHSGDEDADGAVRLEPKRVPQQSAFNCRSMPPTCGHPMCQRVFQQNLPMLISREKVLPFLSRSW